MENKNVPSSVTPTFAMLVRRIFSLKAETDYGGTLEQVRNDVEFNSGNIWALVFAIFIASVGLNVNSTAVIIGAMLISPLMGPIVGAGFALATNDFPLLRRSLRNLLLATVVALVTSTLYFLVSPLEDAQSELLSRTHPTLYDVLIALFGGGAGAVAISRKTGKGNVMPGVAIATALMPPLCTAGFGIAQGNWDFLIGAFHLYLINALFICLATLLFIRAMGFARIRIRDSRHVTRTRVIIVLVTLGIALPSAHTAWIVVRETRFQQKARHFIADNFDFPDRVVLNVTTEYAQKASKIRVTLLGDSLPEVDRQALEKRLADYGLQGTQIEIKQPSTSQSSVDQLMQKIREGVLEDLYARTEKALSEREERILSLEKELAQLRATQVSLRAVAHELTALYPALVFLGIGQEVKANNADATSTVVFAAWKRLPSANEQTKLHAFLVQRLGIAEIRLVNTVER